MSDQRIESFISSHRSRPEEETAEARPVSEAVSFVRGEVQPDERVKRTKRKSTNMRRCRPFTFLNVKTKVIDEKNTFVVHRKK